MKKGLRTVRIFRVCCRRFRSPGGDEFVARPGLTGTRVCLPIAGKTPRV
jgi:hypothetical protein